MRKLRIIRAVCIILMLAAAAFVLLLQNEVLINVNTSESFNASYELTAKRDLLALMIAYPEHITGLEKGKDGTVYIVMQSGSKIAYDDKKVKSFDQKLADADIQDSMEQIYPLSYISTVAKENHDPGRIRVYAFLHEVYGRTQSGIEDNLTTASTGQRNVSFNKNNGASAALEAAFSDVSGILKSESGIYGFVFPTNGTYNYRVVAGTNRLSPHAFGIAIDLKSNPCDYWRWATKEQGQTRLEAYPQKLVRAFEEHLFIWGGKWNHFDFLHYEYRPEIILKAKYYIDPDTMTTYPWYYGFPDTTEVKDCIEAIEWIFE